MPSEPTVAELRLKIKKLKYKLEKEEQIHGILKQDVDRFKTISSADTSI